MRTIRDLNDVQIVLKDLDNFKSRVEATVWDLHGRQIKNGGLATDPNDFVILRQLGLTGTGDAAVTQSATQIGYGEFSMEAIVVNAAPGTRVMVNDFSVDLPKVQTQRVNFCYTPSAMVVDLVAKVMIKKNGVWQTLETLTIPAGSDHSWPTADPPPNRKSPYTPSGLTLDPGDFLNFTVESGSSSGLMIKVNTYA